MKKKTKIAIGVLLFAILAATLVYFMQKTAQATVMSIEPKTAQGTVGQNFTINVEVSDVYDLYGWSFKLTWDSTILEAVNITEGPFLKSGGETLFIPRINVTEGYLTADCTLLGNESITIRNGVLATVQFLVKEGGHCTLGLYDTILADSQEQTITHTHVDSTFKSFLTVKDMKSFHA